MLKQIKKEDFEQLVNKIRKSVHKDVANKSKDKSLKSDIAEIVRNQLAISKLDQFLTLEESVLIVSDFCDFKNNCVYIEDDEETAQKIADNLFMRGINNILNRLANDDAIDCSFDDKINDFYFSTKGKKYGTD